MARFDFSAEFAIRPVIDAGRLLAWLSFVDADSGLTYNAFKLWDGRAGPFVTSDSALVERDGRTYRNRYVRAERGNERGEEWFEQLAREAFEAYHAVTAGLQDTIPEEVPPVPRRSVRRPR